MSCHCVIFMLQPQHSGQPHSCPRTCPKQGSKSEVIQLSACRTPPKIPQRNRRPNVFNHLFFSLFSGLPLSCFFWMLHELSYFMLRSVCCCFRIFSRARDAHLFFFFFMCCMNKLELTRIVKSLQLPHVTLALKQLCCQLTGDLKRRQEKRNV